MRKYGRKQKKRKKLEKKSIAMNKLYPQEKEQIRLSNTPLPLTIGKEEKKSKYVLMNCVEKKKSLLHSQLECMQ